MFRCAITGRFISAEDAVLVEFIPDTPFTEEKIVFVHRDEQENY